MAKKAVVLLSGGLDSAVTLSWARRRGYVCHCLLFDYGQRHRKEIAAGRRVARAAGAAAVVVARVRLPWKGSALIDGRRLLPVGRSAERIRKGGIPSTYVPSRNTIFLGMAASFAEAIGASTVFIGAHQEDSSGYPDCREEYIDLFDRLIRVGTPSGREGRLSVRAPLIRKTKAEIVRLGRDLGVRFELTWSCYAGGAAPCGRCDSCVLRSKGFRDAGMRDPWGGL